MHEGLPNNVLPRNSSAGGYRRPHTLCSWQHTRQPPGKANAGMPLGCNSRSPCRPTAYQATLLPAVNSSWQGSVV